MGLLDDLLPSLPVGAGDQWVTAEFRGAKFEVEDVVDELGARNVIHEFPGRKGAFAEPNGEHARRFTVEAHLIGSGYEARLARLMAALREPGSGKYKHPKDGDFTVALDGPPRISRSTREGGMARVTIVFVETGDPKPTPEIEDNPFDASSGVLDSLSFGGIDTSGFNVIQRAANAILAGPRGITRTLMQINTRIQQTIGIIDDFSQAIDDLAAEVDTLLSTPDQLMAKLQGLMNSVLGAIGTVERNTVGGDTQRSVHVVGLALSNLKAVSTIGDAFPELVGDTPSKNRQRRNQEILVDNIEAAGIAESVNVIATLDLDTEDLAAEVFEAVKTAIDRVLERDTADAEILRQLRRLRVTFYDHIRRIVFDLSGLGEYTPATTMCAQLISYKLYGDATRDSEIVSRNTTIEHPGFVQGGVEIAVADV